MEINLIIQNLLVGKSLQLARKYGGPLDIAQKSHVVLAALWAIK